LKDLDTWERTQGGNAPGQGQTGPTSVMRKDFDGDEWTGRHKGQFDDLIAAARAKVKSAKAKAAEHAAEAAHDASKSLETKAKPPDDMPQASLSTGLSDMDQLKAEQEAIASRTEPVTSKTLNEPISGAQAFLQHAAEDIPMRDATPPSLPSHQQEDFNPLPSSHERHTAHDQRRYSNANPPSSQYHTPAGSPPQEIASLQRADLLPEKLASLEGTRRVPMFQVPEDPVHDNEGFGATSGG
jgi:E3 ubiquitin-protein ligase RAD18